MLNPTRDKALKQRQRTAEMAPNNTKMGCMQLQQRRDSEFVDKIL